MIRQKSFQTIFKDAVLLSSPFVTGIIVGLVAYVIIQWSNSDSIFAVTLPVTSGILGFSIMTWIIIKIEHGEKNQVRYKNE